MIGSIGFIGVGTIATAMIHGLRRRWPELTVRVSPRSEDASRRLAAADPLVHRAASNAAVVEASDVVVLSMLPTQLDDALAGITFRSAQIVVSCVAGASLDQLSTAVAPALACRLIPLPMIARGEGPLVLYPPLPEIRALFDGLGDLIEPADEQAFARFSTGSAAMSTFFTLQGAMAEWIARDGVASEDAGLYVRSLFRALSETAMRTQDARSLVAGHETPGGLNERVRKSLAQQGWFEAPGHAFDAISRLGSSDLGRQEG